ncbi:MAG: hypothetical protein L0H64_18790 [Pseudonocardia sp.]|nr:hypothetical protein [Pseudonocardia sp.]
MITRNRPEVNFRAIRDMGLAAWFGGSLMNLAGLVPASESQPDPVQRHRVYDAGMRGGRGLLTGSVAAYLVGTGMVRFDGKVMGRNGVPRWVEEGVEDKTRTALTVVALGSAVVARTLRDRATKKLDQQGADGKTLQEVEHLRRSGHVFHAIVPAAVGALMYSHLKQDMRRRR